MRNGKEGLKPRAEAFTTHMVLRKGLSLDETLNCILEGKYHVDEINSGALNWGQAEDGKEYLYYRGVHYLMYFDKEDRTFYIEYVDD